jgi:Zn-dependent protease
MFGRKGLAVARIAGIPITIDPSWFLVFLLLVWSLASGSFAMLLPQTTPLGHWVLAVVTVLLLFVSVLIHELAHSLTARRFGIPIRGITLHIFGGVAELTREPPTARAELVVAIMGPISSLLLGIGFGLVNMAVASPVLSVGLGYLAFINLALAIFNLIPGFPLDGGRILRAFIWWRTGDLKRSTRWASQTGRLVAFFFIGMGFFRFLGGSLVDGLWMMLIGMFLKRAAEMSYHTLLLTRALKGLRVRDLASWDVIAVDPDGTIQELVDYYLLGYSHSSYPVIDGNRPIGMISLRHVKSLPRDRWPTTRIREVMEPIDEELMLTPDMELSTALARIAGSPLRRGVVVDSQGALVGVLALSDILRVAALRSAVPTAAFEP